uniref:Putative secreted protein n=1 Tax=Anopheles darlingi TaxID=43151 RepID=A0A2M4DDL4_ANODA
MHGACLRKSQMKVAAIYWTLIISFSSNALTKNPAFADKRLNASRFVVAAVKLKQHSSERCSAPNNIPSISMERAS